MPIDYPAGFDPETTFVTLYAMPDGTAVAHGAMSAPPPVPDGATELTLEQYEVALIAWAAAKAAYKADALAAAQAVALVHYTALHLLMPDATARLLSGYTGPWPVLL